MRRTLNSRHNGGFTLVELLVVVTIIALLIALLLPAVQSAREAARQAQCQNNMKQLGLGCLNYESQYGYFPPSSYFPKGTQPNESRTHYRNWAISLLPFLEQQAVYDSFNLSAPINDSCNAAARGNDLLVMKCPADAGHKVKFSSVDSAEGSNWARGSYAANASLAFYIADTYKFYGAGTNSALSYSRYHRGVMGSNLSMGISEIYDGASNTILVGEVRVGLTAQDRRGTWALDHPGASTLWGHGWTDDNGPNSCQDNSDNIMDCNSVAASLGGTQSLRTACMQCWNPDATGASSQAGPRSQHRGGINVTMVDGSVRFISNYIERTTSSSAWDANMNDSLGNRVDFLCWQRLCASQDGQVVDGKKF